MGTYQAAAKILTGLLFDLASILQTATILGYTVFEGILTTFKNAGKVSHR